MPDLGSARPDLGTGIGLYPIPSRRTVVAYRIGDGEGVVVRVFYGGADYAAILGEMDNPG